MMKNFTFLLTFLTCAFISAQVVIGNGTILEKNVPFELYYKKSYTQSIYLNYEVGTSGSITGLKWQYNEGSTSHENEVEVYLGHTTQTEFADTDNWIPLSDLTMVFDGVVNFTPGWVEITFTIPFEYNGTDHLVIAAKEKTDGYNGINDDFNTTEKINNRSFASYSDTVDIQPENPAEGDPIRQVHSVIPNVELLGLTQNCTISNITVSNITSNEATLSWDQGSADSWKVYYKKDSDFSIIDDESTFETVEVTTNTATLSTLEPGANYYVYVQSICGGTPGAITELNQFVTVPTTITPPYSTSFENGIPLGWQLETNAGNPWAIYTSENYAHTGSSTLSYEFHATQAADSWLFTSGFNLTEGVTYSIGFFERVASSTYPENLKLTIGNAPTVAGQTTTLIDLPNETNTQYVERVESFTPTESGVYYLAFHAYSEADQNRILLDDFYIKENKTFSDFATIGSYWFNSADWADYDNDGDADLLISGALSTEDDPYNAGPSTTHVYDNDGSGNLVLNETIELQGVHTGDPKWIDYDNDGDLDIAVFGMSYADGPNLFALYQNDNGTFTNVDENTQGASFANATVGDYDNDGDLDMLVTGYTEYATSIWKNTGNGFEREDISDVIPGAFNSIVSWADIDNDMDLDIIIAGLTLTQASDLRIYTNNDGVYTEGQVVSTYDGYSRPVLGDYNNDGYLDIATMATDSDYNNFVEILYNNEGTFEHHADLAGLSVSGAASPLSWGDYDNDGDVDLIITGTDSDNNGAVLLYKNNNGNFTEATETGFLPIGGHSLAWQDIDGDLDIDILISGLYDDPENGEYYALTKLYKNQTTIPNTRPLPPTTLNAEEEDNSFVFNWTSAYDAETPESGLSYHLQVGSSSGASDLANYKVTGNSWELKNIPEEVETIYWCVKSIDTSFIYSTCSDEQTVSNMGTDNLASATNQAKLYPNPVTNGVINLVTNDLKGSNIDVNIYNVTGKLLLTQKYENVSNVITIPVDSFETGTYFLTYKTGTETNSLQFIVK